tara:strand:- start:323 stop:928 length:606 start_codon:yes stop_codon:yes gene_type:complete
MKITKSRLKEIIKEEILSERLKRFKVYVSGEKEPLILLGKNEKDVKQLAYQMIQNSSVKVRKVVKEEKLTEAGLMGGPIKGDFDLGANYWVKPERKETNSTLDHLQAFSDKEAKNVIDGGMKNWVKDLRKSQHKIIKDWLTAAKSGKIDYFDLVRGLKTGDVRRAHPYETEFLHQVLLKDKIIDRFRSYFKGKKGKDSRTK